MLRVHRKKKCSLPIFFSNRSKIPSTCRYSNTATDDEVNFSFLFLKSFQHRPAFNYEAGAFSYFDFPSRSLEVSKNEEAKPSKIIWSPPKSKGGKNNNNRRRKNFAYRTQCSMQILNQLLKLFSKGYF